MINQLEITAEMSDLRDDTVRQAVLAIEKGERSAHRIRIDGDPSDATFDASILTLPGDRVVVLATVFDADNRFVGLRHEGYDTVSETATLTLTAFTQALEIAARRELAARATAGYQTTAA
ncbi:hypothetical protein [Leifsonia sp. fls2-241-R2A-40a]|uniref:hypothetical protein n=1 Tax=Leifsonia sp. fls2-241-R2A-40a TaxID=3040290 RepID=UPI002549DFCB|nr:hypothetical protein [Leifsonia sp. fls2-241-R2A-40a]